MRCPLSSWEEVVYHGPMAIKRPNAVLRAGCDKGSPFRKGVQPSWPSRSELADGDDETGKTLGFPLVAHRALPLKPGGLSAPIAMQCDWGATEGGE